MRIYTKTGDVGTTGLFGGDRVKKVHARIEAYGTVDELNAVVGLVRSSYPAEGALFRAVDEILARIQSDLFTLGADLATPSGARPSVPRVSAEMTGKLENDIDLCSEDLPELSAFILPGGSQTGARLHFARTVCRRAERRAVHASQAEEINPEVIRYLNRLSDHLFVLARIANQMKGIDTPEWHPRGAE